MNELRWFIGQLGNYFMLLLLLVLLANTLIANWTWSPYFDILRAQAEGGLFVGTHASVLLFACSLCIFQMAYTRTMGPAILGVFATASMHEFTIMFENLFLGGLPLAALSMSPSFAIWLGAFLIAAIVFCNPYQRKLLGVAALIMIPIFIMGVWGLPQGLTPSSPQILLYRVDSTDMDFLQSLTELITWTMCLSVWLIPKGLARYL